jgi:hypothetical protein
MSIKICADITKNYAETVVRCRLFTVFILRVYLSHEVTICQVFALLGCYATYMDI